MAPGERATRTVRDAVVGVAAALLVFAAVPWVLVGLVGVPLPHHWAERDVVSWRGLFDVLAIASWAAWAACAWPILHSAVSRVRSGDIGTAARLLDRVALRIALGVLAVASLLGLGAPMAGASAGDPGPPLTSAAVALVSNLATGEAAPFAGPNAGHGLCCTVGVGDTLPLLAATHYGDPGAWTAIASANLGRMMHDGTRFVDPSMIAPGWTLALPALDPEADPGATVHPAPRTTSPAAATHPHPDPLPSVGAWLPIAELAAAGVSALVAGLLARRARQLRRLHAFVREEGIAGRIPAEREAELDALVMPFAQVPLMAIVETAARHLGRVIAALDTPPGAVQWLRAGRDGVEVQFSDPCPDALPGWRRSAPSAWLLPATVDLADLAGGVGSDDPCCAALLPLGDDERGTWLIPVAAGTCVAVVGPRAEGLVLAMRAAMASWSWREAIVVTHDVAEATDVVASGGTPRTTVRAARPRVLFIGDPDTLPDGTRHACAALATRQLDDAAVTVVVDDRGASAHPLGLTVRPPLLARSWTGAVEALVHPAPVDTGSSRPLVHSRSPVATLHLPGVPDAEPSTPPDLFSCSPPPPALAGAGAVTPTSLRGRAEVRLLGSIPGIVGLQAELPPKRARRAVELVAYLAMHAPDPVTGDRLRTRVLGSSDADAAAKTLFNTVGAARRALGAGPDGEPLLPHATRSGHYRISPMVTVDAKRAAALLRDGLDSRDPAVAADLLREGLQLVRGEPLAGLLTGYTWWRAEGHERRLADATVDGACALVRAALGSGDVDLARWALGQARKVEPYSESLTRAAMRIAAASGDLRRLHAEWQECQRQIDELDPGGAPSERTEQLYALLRARLSGDGAGERTLRT